MKVLVINASDLSGGAARAAYRLHQGLSSIQVKSQVLAQLKLGNDQSVLGLSSSSGIGQINNGFRFSLDQVPLKLYKNRQKVNFSPQWLPDTVASRVESLKPDIINLHWINSGFVQIESLAKFNKPIVWTLHDMWAFTGGCHYNKSCDRYQKMCGFCPQLSSDRNRDLSRWIWRRKIKAWQNLNLTVVSPSSWLAECAKSSSIFSNARIEVIPNGIDTDIYKPLDKQFARDILRLPKDKRLIIFGALSATSDTRKGFQLLQTSLNLLKNSKKTENLEVVIFGASQSLNPPDFPFKAHYLGTLKDDISLTLAYSASDVFVLPSVQENLPNTVMEAIACGLPCVAFNIGGVPDMIEHQKNGFLAEPYSCENFAKGISWVLHENDRYRYLSTKARETAECRFTLLQQANRYISLFKEITSMALQDKVCLANRKLPAHEAT